MIVESNDDIFRLINHLNKEVIKFRKKYPKSLILLQIKQFYREVVDDWMENFVFKNTEINDQEDEIIKNKILDLMNYINSILKK